jgi:hypothetical protein
MPESPLLRQLLLGLAGPLGPLLDRGLPVHGLRLQDLWEQAGARAPAAMKSLGQAIDQLARLGQIELQAFPGSDPMTDPGTRVALTARGLLAARNHESAIGGPHQDQAGRLTVDLGTAFAEGQLEAPRATSQPAALGARMAEEPWILPVLLLLGLEPRWYLNVLATVLQFLSRQGRVDLGRSSKAVATAKGLGDRCAALVPLLPALYLGKDRGQRTVDLIGALPETRFSADEEALPRDQVDAVLRRAFGLGGIDPLARIPRSGRAGREAMDGVGDDQGDLAGADVDAPEEP